jgi:hypothetical protein
MIPLSPSPQPAAASGIEADATTLLRALLTRGSVVVVLVVLVVFPVSAVSLLDVVRLEGELHAKLESFEPSESL